MKIKKSPLSLLSFHLAKSHFEFIEPKGDEFLQEDMFSKYPIEVEFSHETNVEQEAISRVFVEIKVNHTKKLPGYAFTISGQGVFHLDESGLDEILVRNLKIFSSLNMVINNLRNIIAQQSAFGQMGVFLLPPIDMQDMMKKKTDEEEKKKE